MLTDSHLRSLQSVELTVKMLKRLEQICKQMIAKHLIFLLRDQIVITLVTLQKSVKCKDKIVHFETLRLFSRLILIAERTNKFKELF